MTIAILTALHVADMWSCKFWWGSKATRVGGVVMYFFKSLKASCASYVHWSLSCFLRGLKKGSLLMMSHEMNLLKVAMYHVNFCTSSRLSSGFILVIADTFSRLGSMPRRETIYPSNFPEGTLNVHFLGFSFILNFLRLSKISARSEMSPSSSQVFMTTSSTNAYVLHPICECRHRCIPRW
jgi:hypothetical protein